MDWQSIFFQDWEGIVRTIVVGILAYTTLIVFLRISGKRTLAKLNAFDLVVTVALGSTLSAILLQESVALAECAVALALLILMQFFVTYTSVRWPSFAGAMRAEPTLLVRNGKACREAMKRERITESEALGAIRASGGHHIEEVETPILESDGTLNVSLLDRQSSMLREKVKDAPDMPLT
ncbi:DUF421 domain-containing protein [Bradyrhizobium sp. 190]|uniref:DUF421 domain-containing protein n=1 Tax=Bradyrhizobium sp. 190 TaxID=2782658 RepID=UPI001FF95576|nr:YetF domain-containing protein [Bradyrhizobium sp. 190]MCK1513901.1 DUF421 domain-containing protein [Bradyrhizobium sp. 190]